MAFRASILTLYPEMFPGPLGVSLAGRALEEGIWSLDATNIRDFAADKHRSVDDTPAGGGAWCFAPMCSPQRSTASLMGGRCWR
jgi:tRNA (guanine37-N1)-methyltransferase